MATTTRRRPVPTPSLNGTPAPSDAGANGDRDPQNGRFRVGNKAGKGNPFCRKMARLRSALLESATPERLRDLGEKLYHQAMAGDVASAELYLRYVIGKATPAPNPDEADADELRVAQLLSPRYPDVNLASRVDAAVLAAVMRDNRAVTREELVALHDRLQQDRLDTLDELLRQFHRGRVGDEDEDDDP